MSEVNIELLKQVRDKIATTPEAYDQRVFARKSSAAPCGTAACIAGWACVLSGEMDTAELMRREQAIGTVYESIRETAKRVLCLDENEADTLFTETPEGEPDYDEERGNGWPEPFCGEWADSGRRDRPSIAIAYLNHIIETREVLD